MPTEPCMFCDHHTEGSVGSGSVRLANVCQDCRDSIEAGELLASGRGSPMWLPRAGQAAAAPGLDGDHETRRTGAFVAGRAANDSLPLVSVGPGGIGHDYSTEIGGASNAR